jgi:fructose-specific phosphotransferase system IIC component
MTPELVQAIGQYIVIPICGVTLAALVFWFVDKS